MRAVILIESKVPENDTLPPVPRSLDNEIRLSHQQIAFLPFAARTLSQPDAFRGEMIVEFGLSVRPAPVAMCGSACGEFRGAGIAQDLLGKVDQVPVVIEGHDLCLEMSVSKRRTQMFADEDGLLLGGHPHARIISRNVARLVLGSNGKEGYARGLVSLHEAHEVARKRGEGRRQQRATNHGTGSYHPSGRTPGAGDDFEVGIDGQCFAKNGKNILAISIDGETLQFRIGSPGRRIIIAVVCEREIAGTHGLAENGKADPLLCVKKLLEKRPSLGWRELL